MNDDLISRREAIRAINSDVTIIGRENVELVMAFIRMFTGRIKALPRVRPEAIRCRDCANWETEWSSSSYDPGWHYCPMADAVHEGDFFCGYAEKRRE